ncbi:hypothetical protein [Thiohalobacter sp.]|uniref:hypothetical protein n=1 Tax=Thiohalobacter sp. TaxID=2025948 RepID=UPI002618E7D8|nr:hypothetical protein [Thiohalobacter sp.]
MNEEAPGPTDASLHPFEQRQYRQRRIYWRVLLPLALLLGVATVIGQFLAGALLVIIALLALLLGAVHELLDRIGYLSRMSYLASEQRAALMGRGRHPKE